MSLPRRTHPSGLSSSSSSSASAISPRLQPYILDRDRDRDDRDGMNTRNLIYVPEGGPDAFLASSPSLPPSRAGSATGGGGALASPYGIAGTHANVSTSTFNAAVRVAAATNIGREASPSPLQRSALGIGHGLAGNGTTRSISVSSTKKSGPGSVRNLSRLSNEALVVPGQLLSPLGGGGIRSALDSTAAGDSDGPSAGKGKEREDKGEGRGSKDKDKEREKDKEANGKSATRAALKKFRSTPRLPLDKDMELVPSTLMFWSRAPTYGVMPNRTMRAHSVTLVDTTAWIFGGCHDSELAKDVYCFDIETMQWSYPETVGTCPPPLRAHTTTLVDRKLIIFGGGQGPTYYEDIYIFDTTTRRWSKPEMVIGKGPTARRAHSAVLYKNKIWIFGGGNGATALNDVWTLDVSNLSRMKWEEKTATGRKPPQRGYHTANLVGNVMVIVGGSDGKECYPDTWCLNLDTLMWSQIRPTPCYRRLSHSSTQVGSYLFIVGGHTGTEYTSEMLLFNLVSLQYESRIISGKPPSPRGYHATLLADSRLYLIGGYNGVVSHDEVHLLDLAAGAYLPQVTSFNIEA